MSGNRDSTRLAARAFNLVVPEDPFGTSKRYRRCRIVFKSPDGFRPFCWIGRPGDGSVVFGFSDIGFVAGEIGLARLEKGVLVSDDKPISESIPPENRRDPHVTLHPSGVCHVRSQDRDPLFEHRLAGWYPVQREFNWLHVFSDPLLNIPATVGTKKRDAIVCVPNTTESVKLKVDILPASSCGLYECSVSSLDTLIGLGPDFAVRVEFYSHQPVQGALYVAGAPQGIDKE